MLKIQYVKLACCRFFAIFVENMTRIIQYLIIMKKSFVIVLAVCSALTVVSCKSKQAEFENAYYGARTELDGGQESDAIDIVPVASSTVKDEVKEDVDDSYRTEKVVVAEGSEGQLKAYSVVCGSFSVKPNAENLRASLIDEGYDAIIVQNEQTGMYRVICASYDNRQKAAEARAQFKADHPDNKDFQGAWLLYNK